MADATTVVGTLNATAAADGSSIPHVKQWTLEITAANNEFTTSDTGGWTGRVPGNKDVSGTIECLADDTDQLGGIIDPGDEITALTLTADGVETWSGPAVIESISATVNPETGEPAGHSIAFAGKGAWTVPT